MLFNEIETDNQDQRVLGNQSSTNSIHFGLKSKFAHTNACNLESGWDAVLPNTRIKWAYLWLYVCNLRAAYPKKF